MKKHILLIDDEAPIREMLRQHLTFKGYRVSGAATAVEARQVVQSDPPQLIISDLQMEDTDGLTLIAELKAILPEVPILLLTGMIFDPEVIRDNIGKKVSSYLNKTVPLREVTQEIRRLLGDTK